jgi:hypothetical protein
VYGLSTLGDAMPVAPRAPNGGAKLSVAQYCLDTLARHPDGMDLGDIEAVVRSQRPDVTTNATSAALSNLVARGQARRVGHGRYRLGGEEPKTSGAHHPPAAAAGPAPVAVATLPPSPPPAGTTGDEGVDQDLLALDEALAALARIESVVRRNREVLAQLARLKAALGGLK